MNLQDELAQNALLSGKIAEQEAEKKNEMVRSAADRCASEITASIKSMLLDNARNGKFTKCFNQGTTVCYYRVPQNRYLKLNSLSTYNKKHIRTSLSYRFDINPKYKTEFEHLQEKLRDWGDANETEISWVVKAEGYAGEYEFPCSEYHPFSPPYQLPKFRLEVKATSHFPVDPSLPIDYMSEKDIEDQKRKAQELAALKAKYQKIEKTNNTIVVILMVLIALLIVLYLVLIIS